MGMGIVAERCNIVGGAGGGGPEGLVSGYLAGTGNDGS